MASPTGSRSDAGKDTTALEDLRQWSEPLTLQAAVSRAPVLVKLEDGFRGEVESLSFSLDDVMALEGVIVVKGRRLVLAHYTSEMEGDDGEDDEEDHGMYRSLLTIPWEYLPPVKVRAYQDPGGLAYNNFLTAHFPQCNWRAQQQQLLGSLDEGDYDTVRELPPHLALKPQPTSASQSRRPPPPPPKPSPTGHALRRPPPAPPRLSPDEDTRKATRVQQQADDKQGTPPPRPPRLTRALTKSSPNTDDEVQKVCQGFAMPTFAEMYTPSSGPASAAVLPMGKGAEVDKADVLFPSELAEGQTAEEDEEDTDREYLELVDEPEDVEYIEVGGLKKEEAKHKHKHQQQQHEKPEKTKISQKQEKKEDKKTAYGVQKPEAKRTYVTSGEEKKEWKNLFSIHKEEQQDKQRKVGQGFAFVKPTVHVQPMMSEPTSPTMRPQLPRPVASSCPAGEPDDDDEDIYEVPTTALGLPLQKMTCKQLSGRLKLCGMPKLADACETNCLDGAFFCTLPDDVLKKPPFSLTDFEVDIKLQKVKSGWVPT